MTSDEVSRFRAPEGMSFLMLILAFSLAIFIGGQMVQETEDNIDQLREVCEDRRPNTSFELYASSDIHCRYEDGEIYPKHHSGPFTIAGFAEIIYTATYPVRAIYDLLRKYPFWGSIITLITFFYTAQFVRRRYYE